MSLTSELDDRTSPVSRYLCGRFLHVRNLDGRYRQPVAEAAPLAPIDGAQVACGRRRPSTGGCASCSSRRPTCTWRCLAPCGSAIASST